MRIARNHPRKIFCLATFRSQQQESRHRFHHQPVRKVRVHWDVRDTAGVERILLQEQFSFPVGQAKIYVSDRHRVHASPGKVEARGQVAADRADIDGDIFPLVSDWLRVVMRS